MADHRRMGARPPPAWLVAPPAHQVVEMTTLHIHRVPMEEWSREPDGVRWCFVCRKRVEFVKIISVPVDPMSYYGPSGSVQCPEGHDDGDLFPGRYREWGDTE